MTSHNGKDWIPHPLDALDANKLRRKVIEKKVFMDLSDKSEESIKQRRHIKKIGAIIRLEHQLSGEEDW